jgi:1-aminocyclopropane-1-carboxylate deaminase/D-cysteine desulfhydrase-like pyridoxal-dependent ACC family enzyme
LTAEYINNIFLYFEKPYRLSHEDLDIRYDTYTGLGYNIPDTETLAVIERLARREAIFLDPCYTGKAFRGFLDMAARGEIAAGNPAVFLHTGGAPDLWSREQMDFIGHHYGW